MIHMKHIFGQSGVAESESSTALFFGKIFRYLTLALIVWLAIEWRDVLQYNLACSHGESTPYCMDLKQQLIFGHGFFWAFFVIQLITMLTVTKDRWHYFKSNWAISVIVAVGVPVILNVGNVQTHSEFILPAMMVFLMLPWVDVCIDSLSDGKISTTLMTAFVIILLAGILMTDIDPQIKNLGDGVWWAWVTVTTVGYGDITPTSPMGRVLASGLMLLGLILFSTITANFAAYFVKRRIEVKVKNGDHKKIRQIESEEQQIMVREDEIAASLELITQRLDDIEKKLNDKE